MESMKAMTQHGEDDELRRFGKCAGTGEVDHRIFCPYDPMNPPRGHTRSTSCCNPFAASSNRFRTSLLRIHVGVTPNAGGRKRALPANKFYESKKGWSQPKLHRWSGNRANVTKLFQIGSPMAGEFDTVHYFFYPFPAKRS